MSYCSCAFSFNYPKITMWNWLTCGSKISINLTCNWTWQFILLFISNISQKNKFANLTIFPLYTLIFLPFLSLGQSDIKLSWENEVINVNYSLKTHGICSKLVAFDSICLILPQKHVSFVKKSWFVTKNRRFSCLRLFYRTKINFVRQFCTKLVEQAE